MDHLPYDRVEEVATFLPRSDVVTIARVAARNSDLENWSRVANDQLERRFSLEVYVHLQGFEREERRSPRIRLSAQKLLPNGRLQEWDFRNWQYAWIHELRISASHSDEPSKTYIPRRTYKESDIRQATRLVSLPVDPSARTRLLIINDCGEDSLRGELADLFWDAVQKTQERFADVSVHDEHHQRGDAPSVFEEFIVESIERGAFSKDLSYFGPLPRNSEVYRVVAWLFRERIGRPQNIRLDKIHFEAIHIELIVDAWLASDGIFEKKEVVGDNRFFGEEELWSEVKAMYRTMVQVPHGGYLAHPTKLSSLFMSSEYFHLKIRVVKFEPWHAPVDLEWIEAVIKNWREGCGFYAWKGERNFSFTFERDDDWVELINKYGPAVGRRLSIAHPKSPIFLEVRKSETQFEVSVEHEFYTEKRMKDFISDWKEGNGDTLLNGLTRIEVQMDCERSPLPQKHSHPLINACCKISPQWCHKSWEFGAVRICIAPIDPEEVDDWNWELLFGSQQVQKATLS